MALVRDDVWVGRDARSVYTEKVEAGYTVNKLPSIPFFSEIFEFEKGTDRIVIGTNKNNIISFYFMKQVISKSCIDESYIRFLEHVLETGYKSVNDNFLNNVDEPDVTLLNAVYNDVGEIVILCHLQSKKENEVDWIHVCISSTLMGYRPYGQPIKYKLNSNNKNDSDFDTLLSGLVNAFGVASMF